MGPRRLRRRPGGARVLVELSAPDGTAGVLNLLERDGPGFQLLSTNPTHPPLPGGPNLRVVARLRKVLDQAAINALAARIGQAFKREDVASLYGQPYNPGNWQSGQISLPGHAILFVTLQKSDAMSYGSKYVDHFEGPDAFVWSSQTSGGPDRKKGREILDVLDTGTSVHLWVRRRKTRRRAYVPRPGRADIPRGGPADVRQFQTADPRKPGRVPCNGDCWTALRR